MQTNNDIILSSIIQAEGRTTIDLPFIQRFLELPTESTNLEICRAISMASTNGKIGELNEIAAKLPPGLIGRLSALLAGTGLPIELAEMEAETVVRLHESQMRSERLAHIVQNAIENPQEAAATLAELKTLLEPPDEPSAAIPDTGMKALVETALVRYDDLYQNRGKTGVMTGFSDFDRVTGGLKPGQVTVVAAATNGGKSTFALNVVNYVVTQGEPVLLFTLEMNRDSIANILFAMNCQIGRNGFNTGRFQQIETEKAIAHSGRIAKFPLFIDDRPDPTVADIASKVKQLRRHIKLVVIDYVQRVEPFDRRESREQQVAAIARNLSTVAKANKVPMLMLSQLNDEGMIRESRVVAHEADDILLLDVSGSEMNVKVVKGRFIPKIKFTLEYLPQFALLRDQQTTRPPYADDI